MSDRARIAIVSCIWVLSATLVVGQDATARLPGDSALTTLPTVTLAFGGDVILGADVNTYVARHGAEAPLAAAADLRDADLAMVNLESVVGSGADAVDTGNVGDYYFLARPETLAVLATNGIDLVSTANNHARDYGPAALDEEDRILTDMGLAHPGIGRDVRSACAPAYLAAQGLRIAVLSINAAEPAYATGDGQFGTCYLSVTDLDAWTRAVGPVIDEARTKADVVVLLPHFRASFSTAPDPADRAAAKLLIDLGADVVLGGGAHAVQGLEVHDGRPILHNAGSLLLDFPEPAEAAYFILTLSSAGVEGIRTVPLVTERSWTRSANPLEATDLLAAMDARSWALGTIVNDGTLVLDPPARDRPTHQPDPIWRSNPGPAPGPRTEPPTDCTVSVVPEDASMSPIAVGPLTLVGARTERGRLDGPTLIWLETYWRIGAATARDLEVTMLAVPERGSPWQGIHEPCEWAWPTSRWKPEVIYRDRSPLRPPPEVQRLQGIPAILSGTGYGPLVISVEVTDQGRSLGVSGPLRTVVLDPAPTARVVIAAVVVAIALLVVGFVAWRRRQAGRNHRSA